MHTNECWYRSYRIERIQNIVVDCVVNVMLWCWKFLNINKLQSKCCFKSKRFHFETYKIVNTFVNMKHLSSFNLHLYSTAPIVLALFFIGSSEFPMFLQPFPSNAIPFSWSINNNNNNNRLDHLIRGCFCLILESIRIAFAYNVDLQLCWLW